MDNLSVESVHLRSNPGVRIVDCLKAGKVAQNVSTRSPRTFQILVRRDEDRPLL